MLEKLKRITSTRKKILALILILLSFYAFQIPMLEKSIFNIQFVDEDDNFVTGTWVNKKQKLYKDIFFQHQPSATYISAAVQEITKPNSIFLLVKRHRELIFIYSAVTLLLLTLRFGFAGFVLAMIYETTKFYLLGNLFLGEVLAVPPLLFVIGLIYEKISRGEKLTNRLDLTIALISIFFIQWTLSSLVPLAITSVVFIWYVSSKALRSYLLKFLGIYLVFLGYVFLEFIPIFSYLRDTAFLTSAHNIPEEVGSLSTFIMRLFFYPILAFNFQNSGFSFIFKVLSITFVFSILFLIKQKAFKVAIYSMLFFWLSNLRPAPFGTFYSGFHLLPMYCALLWLTVLNINLIALKDKLKIKRLAIFYVFLGPLILISFISYEKEITTEFNREGSFYTNYSPKFDYGEVVKVLSDPEDKLIVGSSDSLIYWQSTLPPSSPFFYTYGFMYKSDELRREVGDSFSRNLPKFFYFNGNFEKDLIYASQSSSYRNIALRGKDSYLYVLKNEFKNISDLKWQEAERLGFTKEKSQYKGD